LELYVALGSFSLITDSLYSLSETRQPIKSQTSFTSSKPPGVHTLWRTIQAVVNLSHLGILIRVAFVVIGSEVNERHAGFDFLVKDPTAQFLPPKTDENEGVFSLKAYTIP